jgi:hypothetical protein
MKIEPYLISGVALGIEYVGPDLTDDGEHTIVLDIGILRLLFTWEAQ